MKGMNELRLNQSTMQQALQRWLDANWVGATPVVESVSWAPDGPIDGWFVVKVTEPKKPSADEALVRQ